MRVRVVCFLFFFWFLLSRFASQLSIAKNETRTKKKVIYGSPPRLISVLIDIPLSVHWESRDAQNFLLEPVRGRDAATATRTHSYRAAAVRPLETLSDLGDDIGR